MTDEAFFSIKIGKFNVNILNVIMGTALIGVGYFASTKLGSQKKEGACPVDHSERSDLIKFAKQ